MASLSHEVMNDRGTGDSQDSPIGSLSLEILQSIFEYVRNLGSLGVYLMSLLTFRYDRFTSPSTLPSLTLVNKIFYASGHALKNRHHVFTLKGDMTDRQSKRSMEIIFSLLTDPAKRQILHSICSITVMSTPNRRPLGIRTGNRGGAG